MHACHYVYYALHVLHVMASIVRCSSRRPSRTHSAVRRHRSNGPCMHRMPLIVHAYCIVSVVYMPWLVQCSSRPASRTHSAVGIYRTGRHACMSSCAHTHARTTLLSAIHAAHPQAQEPPIITLRFLLNNRGTHRQVEAVESAVVAYILATMGAPI